MSLFVPCTQTVTYVGEKTLKTGKDRKGLVRDISEENHAASIRSRNTGQSCLASSRSTHRIGFLTPQSVVITWPSREFVLLKCR